MLLEEPEEFKASVKNSRLPMMIIQNLLIRKNSRKLCTISELVLIQLKLVKLSKSLIEMAVDQFLMMNSSDPSEVR